ncbi:hypothetical protein DDE18_08325 [Nocardioides gansuensis]|uniref:Uncharacterized protein n=1 Tax=Nocardioides gansuensis TaxID=2138300 RepID=A0A2T8FC69_9ACTN|nr:hypothetical protein DDE18_08325 [Nocardioides gansuensis]
MAEALTSGSDPTEACRVVGRRMALDGSSLEEAHAGLHDTWQAVNGCDPSYAATSALLVAWSDATLAYMHQLSCEDPTTGLATQAHVRSQLADLYRKHVQGSLCDTHALVVCELGPAASADGVEDGSGQLERSLRLARLGDDARTVFPLGETIGRLGARRVVVVARRDERLGARVRLLRNLVSSLVVAGVAPRVWIEGLPSSDTTAAVLLDELARG